ncbi:MAG: sugar MFS transporter [Methylovulum sp.]|nr:sugar MFS transporter [Methylovulum sp.]
MTGKKVATPSGENQYRVEITILTSLFFIWGFITCLNDILIPHLKAVFTLNYAQAMLIQFCFFSAYFVVSLPSGYLVEKIGHKNGIIIGLAIAGSGCLLFQPAAGLRSYPLFLSAFFVLASGITLLQVSANPYVTLLGSVKTASGRLTLAQAFNSLGTTLAPYFGAMLILDRAVKTPAELAQLSNEALTQYQLAEASAVQDPYWMLAAILFLLAVLFAVVKLPIIQSGGKAGDLSQQDGGKNAWQHRHLLLGAVGIFLYVGAEVSIGSFLVGFLGETNGLAAPQAAKYVSFYWGGAMVGRFIGAFVMQKVSPGKVLTFNALSAALLVLVTLLGSGNLLMVAILAVGLFNSIMFPTIFSLAIAGLGRHTGQGSGILCAAIVGGAILPVVQGWFADHIGIQQAFFIPMLCYFYIAYYGWKGSVCK